MALVVVGLFVALGVATFLVAWLATRGSNEGGLRVFSDRLELDGETFRLDEVARLHVLRLPGGAAERVEVALEDGRRLVLEPPWPLEKVVDSLRGRALPRLVARAEDALALGGELEFREPRSWGAPALLAALVAGTVAAGVIAMATSAGWIEALLDGKKAVVLLGVAASLVGRVVATRGGGLVLSRHGVRGFRDAESIPWDELAVRPGEVLELVGRGRTFRMSPAAANELVARELVLRRAKTIDAA